MSVFPHLPDLHGPIFCSPLREGVKTSLQTCKQPSESLWTPHPPPASPGMLIQTTSTTTSRVWMEALISSLTAANEAQQRLICPSRRG